ncbi:MAG: Uma2 family endonuclease [Rhizonema sp. PD38]|nr:Uma2 family endonuclease [Rhizonema sp. PD38]
MTQTQTEVQFYTFDEFIEWYPENSEVRYELHDGVIVEVPKPRGKHSKLTGFLIEELGITIREIGKRGIWFIPRESIIKPHRDKSGYEPDIIVLNQETIGTETRWETESIIQNATSVKLIVEVVSQCVAEPVLKTGFPSQASGETSATGGFPSVGDWRTRRACGFPALKQLTLAKR